MFEARHDSDSRGCGELWLKQDHMCLISRGRAEEALRIDFLFLDLAGPGKFTGKTRPGVVRRFEAKMHQTDMLFMIDARCDFSKVQFTCVQDAYLVSYNAVSTADVYRSFQSFISSWTPYYAKRCICIKHLNHTLDLLHNV